MSAVLGEDRWAIQFRRRQLPAFTPLGCGLRGFLGKEEGKGRSLA